MAGTPEPGGAPGGGTAAPGAQTAPGGGTAAPGGAAAGQADAGSAPAISLPKGGGAIRGIGEKFTANPVTGTATMSVPLAISPGRAGFGPSLSLDYDSGAGNGPFGIGWGLSLPAIRRKTDRGLPRYADGPEDTFILSGSEDLVPVRERAGDRWVRAPDRRSVDGRDYEVERYRPRVEGLFARIERWTDERSGETHWRSITRDNVTTVYGETGASRIADPGDPGRVFTWLICRTYDCYGNAAVYEYVAEDGEGVDLSLPHERGRPPASRTANRHLKRVRYGNRVSHLVQPDLARAEWLFELVFDYGDHDPDDPAPDPAAPWPCRADPFSSYRAGFEVRTYRLCRRVLMFHHFPEEEGIGAACLVRSTDLGYREDPVASYMTSVEQRGYRRRPAGGYVRRALPPLEFSYSRVEVDDRLRTVDTESLENLPAGVDDSRFRWVDLNGEGLSGILTEDGGAWRYKPNRGGGRFGPLETVASEPAATAAPAAARELLDLAGDGLPDLVTLGGPAPGFHGRTATGGWEPFRPFASYPNLAPDGPGRRLIDLTGDGHADLLVGEGGDLTWYPSLAESGFASPLRAPHPVDADGRVQLVFADADQSLFFADMSGDGLADLVRIRNGEVRYWPSLGYARFGDGIAMDGAPWFDEPDQFDPRRVRLADLDGSGTTDIVYLHRDAVRLYFNRSGNSWSEPASLVHAFPHIDSAASVSVVDLLGNGTACLVWSSKLPGQAVRQLSYVDLMSGQKPHLLVGFTNNLGVETRMHYAPSTRFYVEDREAGRPWATRLPFPVHVLERVETLDQVSHNRFETRYAYHHGYFDGVEREFRGFGLVDQIDSEAFAAHGRGSNVDAAFHVPPVLTRTWFHTGTPARAAAAADPFEHEYYRESEDLELEVDDLLLPESSLPGGLPAEGLRQASRALKGSVLRQEVYALDGGEAESRPYNVSDRNYAVRLIQPPVDGAPGVFFSHPRESLTARYERTLYEVDGARRADPRVDHELLLAVDDWGNVERQASVAYGRRHSDPFPALTDADREAQRRTYVTYTDKRFTNAVERPDAHRAPQVAETRDWEVAGLEPDRSRPGSTDLFAFEELGRKLDRIEVELPPERWDTDVAATAGPARRTTGRTRTRYRRDDLDGPLPAGVLEPLALPFETLSLALTPDLLAELYGERVDESMLEEAGYVADGEGWWKPSPRTHFSHGEDDPPAEELHGARRHFFQPLRIRDPFGRSSLTAHDAYDLLPLWTRDAAGNMTSAGERDPDGSLRGNGNDYRVLAPRLVSDPNRNRGEVAFDALGTVVATAVMGKPEEQLGDTLEGVDPDPDEAAVTAVLADPLADPAGVLGRATTRVVYDPSAYSRTRDDGQPQPMTLATFVRETHASELPEGESTQVQIAVSYSDGLGRAVQRKVLAGPGRDGAPRWVGTGWMVFNNKGKPVRRYEPFFADHHRFELARTEGVSPVLFYDPVERVVATLHPDDTWEKVVFDPWHQATWDPNDTVLADPRTDPDVGGFVARYLEGVPDWSSWHAARAGGERGPAERAAAAKAAAHAGTPQRIWVNSLGRTFVSIDHNRRERDGRPADQLLVTRVRFDAQGQEREVTDPRGRLVMRYGYDLGGTRTDEASMDAGRRLHLKDIAGKPVRTWNDRGFRFTTVYDELRRPVRSYVLGDDARQGEVLHQRTDYGDGEPDAEARNLRNQIVRQYDAAGLVENEAYDFRGNLTRSTRRLAEEYRTALDWSGEVALAQDGYSSSASYDATGRPIRLTTPDGSVVEPEYDERGLMRRLYATLRGSGERTPFVATAEYDARGQRLAVTSGNGTVTRYRYDRLTLRLDRLWTERRRDGRRLQDLRYTYDAAGNVTSIRDRSRPRTFFRNSRVEPDFEFTYDALYWLIEAGGREHAGQVAAPDPFAAVPHPSDGQALARYVERYAYDEAGNLVEVAHRGQGGRQSWRRTYRYAEPSRLDPDETANRLTTTADAGRAGDVARRYEYDAHGNTTSMPHLSRIGWDHVDRLQTTARQVVGDGGVPETTYYVYDTAGQRIRVATERQAAPGREPTLKCERIYRGNFELYREYGPDGAVTLERETLHVVDDRRRVAMVETRTEGEDRGPRELQRYQLPDHLGSVTLELDATAAIVSYEEYRPYGSTAYQAVRSETEAPKRYRYAGMEHDRASGLAYHGARYYAAWLGRWTACDPAGPVDGPNLYRYSRNNPLKYVDPGGTQAVSSDDNPNNPANYGSFEDFQAGARGPWTDEGLRAEWDAAHPPACLAPVSDTAQPNQSSVYGPPAPDTVDTGAVTDEPAAEPIHPDNFELGSSGVRLRADVPRGEYRNHIAQMHADRGEYRLAEIAEAGHGCAYCHIVKEHDSFGEADAAIDLRHYNRVAVAMYLMRMVGEQMAMGSGFRAMGSRPVAPTGGRGSTPPPVAEFGPGLGRLANAELRVSQRGLDMVERHLARFGPAPENTAMLARLRTALAEGRTIRGADASFYMHELNEATRMAPLLRSGMSLEEAWGIAHPAAIQKYGVSPFSVYHPEAITAANAAQAGSFNANWMRFWEWMGGH